MPDILFGLGNSHRIKRLSLPQKSSWSSEERNPSSDNDSIV